jgi:uncharacterized protein YjbI with pentapeptide repeats
MGASRRMEMGNQAMKISLLPPAKFLNSQFKWLKTKFTQIKLAGADFAGVDLLYANLAGADLANADLRYANLTGADLWNAHLVYANLSGADLSCANLQKANLYGANLQQACLRGADLQAANLLDADLWEANLQDVKNLTLKQLQESKNWEQARNVSVDLIQG